MKTPNLIMRTAVNKMTALSMIATLAVGAAYAFTAPAAGDLGFSIYDIIVNRGIEGPIGVMAGIMALVFGLFTAIRGQMITGVMALVAGAGLISAEAIILSLGYVV